MTTRPEDPRDGLRHALVDYEMARQIMHFADPHLAVYAAVVAEEGWRLLEALGANEDPEERHHATIR